MTAKITERKRKTYSKEVEKSFKKMILTNRIYEKTLRSKFPVRAEDRICFHARSDISRIKRIVFVEQSNQFM